MNLQKFQTSISALVEQKNAYHRLCDSELTYDAARHLLAAMHKWTIEAASDHLIFLAALTGRKLKGMP